MRPVYGFRRPSEVRRASTGCLDGRASTSTVSQRVETDFEPGRFLWTRLLIRVLRDERADAVRCLVPELASRDSLRGRTARCAAPDEGPRGEGAREVALLHHRADLDQLLAQRADLSTREVGLGHPPQSGLPAESAHQVDDEADQQD